MRALFVLSPTESKRLIGKAVAQLEEVKIAFRKTNILVNHGSTCIYCLEELLGKDGLLKLFNPSTFVSGLVIRGTLCSAVGSEKPPVVLIKRGMIIPPPPSMSELLQDFRADSVVIKGANAIDPEGNVGALVAHPEGGTIGWALGTILARGIQLICPVGLEKMVPSVKKAAALLGQETLDYVQGKKVGMIPLVNAKVITEIEALQLLANVKTDHVASGGLRGSEGSVVLVSEGDREQINKAVKLIDSIKGESTLDYRKGICEICVHATPGQQNNALASVFSKFCQFQGKQDEELPSYLKNR